MFQFKFCRRIFEAGFATLDIDGNLPDIVNVCSPASDFISIKLFKFLSQNVFTLACSCMCLVMVSACIEGQSWDWFLSCVMLVSVVRNITIPLTTVSQLRVF